MNRLSVVRVATVMRFLILTAALPACLAVTCAGNLRGAESAVLHLTNGGFVAGDLKGSQAASRLGWQSPLFTSPFQFDVKVVNAVHFPLPAKLPKAQGDYRFELSQGDVVFGKLIGWEGDNLELEISRIGRVTVRKADVLRINRWRDSTDLVYLGPNGLAGWKTSSSGGKGWFEEFGHLTTDQDGASLRSDFELPSRAAIEFEVSWKKRPDFVFGLGAGDDDTSFGQAWRFEVWDGDLVFQREVDGEFDLAAVQKISAGPGRAHLCAYLDQEVGRCLVYSSVGEQLADLTLPSKNRKPLTGVRLDNKHGGLRLERLRIARWAGALPKEIQADKPRVHRTDGSIVYGNTAGFDAARNEFIVRGEQAEQRIAADQVDTVILTLADDPGTPRALRAMYQDGAQVSGELLKVEEGFLALAVPGTKQPLRLPVEGLRSLIVLRHETADAAEENGPTGTLELEGLRLRGRLVDGKGGPAASCLVWQPLSSATASPLRPGVSGRIVYREPPPAQRQSAQVQPAGMGGNVRIAVANNGVILRQALPVPALVGGVAGAAVGAGPGVKTGRQAAPETTGQRALHLRTGDTIPCEVTGIDEEGIRIRTALSDSTFVAHARIKAVELSNESAGALRLNKVKRERLLTLPRMQKDNPPTQLIRSRNGDILRGRIVAMDDAKVTVEVRLETKVVPRERISQIIWLHPDELEGEEAAAAAPGDNEVEQAGIRVQVLRSDGIRLTFFAEQMNEATLSGTSDILGACRVGLNQVDQLLIGGAIEQAASMLAYQQWKLHNALEPKTADGGSGDGSTGLESPLVGKPAPDFELALLDGKRFRLSESRGRVIVLDFWATWCGPCIQAMPQVDAAVRDFADQGVQLVAVNLEETPKQITAMLERHKLEMTVALDRDGAVGGKYSATAIPQTVIIDREGKVARLYVGGGPQVGDQIREALQAVLGGNDGDPKGDPKDDPKGDPKTDPAKAAP